MRALERYVLVGSTRMRCGYTTGTCAAGASRAAAETLLGADEVTAIEVETPAQVRVVLEVEACEAGKGWASCAVRKDAGDDPDVTDGALVYARVALRERPGVTIEAGRGVGRVTRPGLDQPVGAAAINRVPRKMIEAQLEEAAHGHGYGGGFDVVISIPEGVHLAARTFNPRLGIEGGISVLGTSGIVRPMSDEALVASVEIELRQLYAGGARHLLVSPGNYGCNYARDVLGLDVGTCVQCSNHIGRTVDMATALGFEDMLVVGHIGKLSKVSAGIMNTHSRVADARGEIFAAHTALAGASRELVGRVMGCATTDDMLRVLEEAGLREAVMAGIMERLEGELRRHGQGACDVEAVVFSKVHGLLGMTSGAPRLVELHRTRGAVGTAGA